LDGYESIVYLLLELSINIFILWCMNCRRAVSESSALKVFEARCGNNRRAGSTSHMQPFAVQRALQSLRNKGLRPFSARHV